MNSVENVSWVKWLYSEYDKTRVIYNVILFNLIILFDTRSNKKRN